MGLLARDLRRLETSHLGTIPYADAWERQTTLHERRSRGEIGDTLLLLEHPHVYTIGRRGTRDDVLQANGVDVVETDRGGRVTYHGPGQIVGYPIIEIGADLVGYVRRLEDVLIATLERFGIEGERDEGNTGVWTNDAKIAAIGVRVTRGVTKHGFALNVSTDLSYFAGIVPCGIIDRGVTSMRHEGSLATISEVADVVDETLRRVFGYAS